MSFLSAASMESYGSMNTAYIQIYLYISHKYFWLFFIVWAGRAYPYLVQLHILQEIEESFRCSLTAFSESGETTSSVSLLCDSETSPSSASASLLAPQAKRMRKRPINTSSVVSSGAGEVTYAGRRAVKRTKGVKSNNQEDIDEDDDESNPLLVPFSANDSLLAADVLTSDDHTSRFDAKSSRRMWEKRLSMTAPLREHRGLLLSIRRFMSSYTRYLKKKKRN